MDFANASDEFFVNINLQTALLLPDARETVLHFFEAMQKQFPAMSSFYQREDSGEYVLEADRERGTYAWAELHPRRLCAGFFNPPSLAEAYQLHRWVLERATYYLGVGAIDVDALDVLFGFNLEYVGNRDALVAEALLADGPLGQLAAEPDVRVIEYEPSLVFALDEGCNIQARVNLETRCNSFQVRTGQFDDEPISVYFTVRRYPAPGQPIELLESFELQADHCEDLSARLVVPQVIQPIAQAIAAAS